MYIQGAPPPQSVLYCNVHLFFGLFTFDSNLAYQTDKILVSVFLHLHEFFFIHEIVIDLN